jgi:hypothetical protein
LVPVISLAQYPGARFFPEVSTTGLVAPVGGGFLYVKGGQLFFRNASGETQVTNPPPPPLGPWGAVANFATGVPFSSVTISATMPGAVPAGAALFALVTSNGGDAPPLTVVDNVNVPPWTRCGFVVTGGAGSREGWLYCFPGSAAAGPGALTVVAAQPAGTFRLHVWSQAAPLNAVGLTIGPTSVLGGSSASAAAGPIITTQKALIVMGARQLNTGVTFTPAAGFTLAGGQVDGVMQCQVLGDAPPGTYNPALGFGASGAADWCALSVAIYAH